MGAVVEAITEQLQTQMQPILVAEPAEVTTTVTAAFTVTVDIAGTQTVLQA